MGGGKESGDQGDSKKMMVKALRVLRAREKRMALYSA